MMTTLKLVLKETSPNSSPKPPCMFCSSPLVIVNVISSDRFGGGAIIEVCAGVVVIAAEEGVLCV